MTTLDPSIVIALIALVISVVINLVGIGNLKGIILTKLDYIEKKQDKHNGLIERMVKVEQKSASAHHRLDRIEDTKN